MTDTVNVPQEMIDAVMRVAVGVDEYGAEVFPGPFVAAELVRAMLAAAPKAEPHLGFLVETDDGTEWVADDPRMSGAPEYYDNLRPFTLEEAKSALLAAWEVAQPEAPKVEREPFGYAYPVPNDTYVLLPQKVLGGRAGKPLFTRPDPASDELLEALREVTPELTAEFSNIDGPWCRGQMDMDEVWSRLIDAQITAIAEHKGPQS